jgi:cytochrome o ubiquinol oxidase subunit 2
MRKPLHVVLAGLWSLCVPALLAGCGDILLFDPKGPIGRAEMRLILTALGLMLIVVIPVLVMTFWFARKYRASNTKATYAPKWSYSVKIDLAMWLIPIAIVTVLATLTWRETRRLDPYKPIKSGVDPVSIEAVSMDWKWLFIYPHHNIATLNQLVFPANVPLSFRITSETVMTSFFIPQLGSQIYAMAGMETRLHLLANEPGTYTGQNQQFSGPGYSDMHFDAIATSREQFEAWVQEAKRSPDKLDLARYEELAKPSGAEPVTYFSSVTPGLFDHIISRYTRRGTLPGAMGKDSGSTHGKTVVLEGH